MWMGTIGLCYVCVGIGIVVFVAYLLYGPSVVSMNVGKTIAATSTSETTGVPTVPSVTVVPSVPSPVDSAAGAFFSCSNGKSLKADFKNSSVALTLSDGRAMILPHALSADGARYANADESFVFWNVGNTAFIEEAGTRTYDGCSTSAQ